MHYKEYKRLTLAEMQKRRWRTARQICRNDGSTIPARVEVKIVEKQGGLTIRALPCPHCGVELGARKLAPEDVEELPTSRRDGGADLPG